MQKVKLVFLRKGYAVLIRYAGTENVISKAEIEGSITDDMVKAWRLCGLDDSDIKQIVGFLRS